MVEQVFNKTVDLMFEGLLTTGLSIKYDLHFFLFRTKFTEARRFGVIFLKQT